MSNESENANDEFLSYAQRELNNLTDRPKIIKVSENGTLSIPKILEIYVHTVIAKRFKESGWEVHINSPLSNNEGSNEDSEDPIFRYRGAPSKRSSTRNGFNHFILHSPNSSCNQALELHLGVQVEGISSVFHELDILICESLDGPSDISCQNVILAAEVKRYAKSTVDKRLAREFIGVLSDTTSLMIPLRNYNAFHNHEEDKKWDFFLSTEGANNRTDDINNYLNIFNVKSFLNFSLSMEEELELHIDSIIDELNNL